MKNPFLLLKFVGTDAFLMQAFIPGMGWKWKLKILAKRILVKFLDRYFVQEYIIDHGNLGDYLRRAGLKKPARVFSDPVKHPRPYTRKKHDGFNVVYYDPSGRKKNKEAIRWIYGIDLIEGLKKELPYINFIAIDGTHDMAKIWPIADFYLRPNRTDGASRLRQEAVINGVPFYWSYEFPEIDEAKRDIIWLFNNRKYL